MVTSRSTAPGTIIVSTSDRLQRILTTAGPTQVPELITTGWTNPFAFTLNRNDKLWVADNSGGVGKEHVAAGGEKNGPKRRRFWATLPPGTSPSGIAASKTELLVCSKNNGTLERLHVGLDHVARPRKTVAEVRCQLAVVALPDGSIITATERSLLRYPSR